MVVDEVWHGKNFGIPVIEFIFIGSYGGGGGSYGGRGGSYGQLLSLIDDQIFTCSFWNLKEKKS